MKNLYEILKQNGTGILKGTCRIMGYGSMDLNEDTTETGIGFEYVLRTEKDIDKLTIRFSLNENYLGEYMVLNTGFSFGKEVQIYENTLYAEMGAKKNKESHREVINLIFTNMNDECADFYAVLNPS
ncbi:MAG: hypothetical protein WC795_02610 [Candidatus Paceibacterota bacterium]|jgi:hypothetical protein